MLITVVVYTSMWGDIRVRAFKESRDAGAFAAVLTGDYVITEQEVMTHAEFGAEFGHLARA